MLVDYFIPCLLEPAAAAAAAAAGPGDEESSGQRAAGQGGRAAPQGEGFAPAFSAAKGGELWVCLLEKAWAKLHGLRPADQNSEILDTMA